LRRGVLAMHLQQLSGGRWPADTTLGSLIDGQPVRLPASLTGELPWQRILGRVLHIVPATEDTPFPPEVAGGADRFSPAAPGVWVERDRRSEAVWAPMVENRGPIALPLGTIDLRLRVTDLDGVPWRCAPAAGGVAMLEPTRQLRLLCRTLVAPSAQGDLFVSAMHALRSGETLRTQWADGAFERAGAERLAERLIAEAALAPRLEPGPSFAQRWAGLSPARRAALVPAALIAAFAVFCAFARAMGERRGFLVWMLLSVVPSYLLGRGEGAASVLLVGMCLVVAVLIALAFSFGYRLYRDFIFRRYA
jgi:hypothetical protein